jgi:hypothetical protein
LIIARQLRRAPRILPMGKGIRTLLEVAVPAGISTRSACAL